MLITVSGEPGSGKTTVARLVAQKLALPHVYAGDLFRREAEARGLSLGEFNALCERDHSIDRALDDRMVVVAQEGNVVLEGRLAGFFARQHGLEALKVRLTASEPVRAERVAGREHEDVRRVLEMNRNRHASDTRRYRQIYGFDLDDTSIYDVVLCSDDQTPEALAERIVAEAHRRFDGGGRQT